MMYSFEEVKKLLLRQEKYITYKSLTSDKEHTRLVTIPKDFQKDSDKIVVWDMNLSTWHDVQINTIVSIVEPVSDV